MKKLLLLSVLSISLSNAFAQEVKTLFGKQNISPTFCQLTINTKTPSCVISIGAEAGTKLSASFIIQKNLSNYLDSSDATSSNFEVNDNYTINPLITSFSSNGTKQVRLIYKGVITPEMTKGEQYGRLLLKLEKDGQPIVHNLPVFFKTQENQKEKIDSIQIENIKVNSPQGTVILPALSLHNSGNGVASYSMIGFNSNFNPDIKNDFASFNGTVLPNSTSKVILNDKRVLDYFKQNPKFVYFINKKTLLIEKITLSNN